jgi:hypothetical protein
MRAILACACGAAEYAPPKNQGQSEATHHLGLFLKGEVDRLAFVVEGDPRADEMFDGYLRGIEAAIAELEEGVA